MMQVINIKEFTDAWQGVLNFLLDPACVPFNYAMPPVRDLVEGLRQDADARITSGVPGDRLTKNNIADSFRRLPIDQALTSSFALAHFDLPRFDVPGGLLEGFYKGIMVPWLNMLSSAGFTWERCYPIIFISGPGCQTNYHMDFSHVLAWQVYGHKKFIGLREPDRWAPADVRRAYLADRSTLQHPPELTDNDMLAYDMPPGSVLWNAFLTPHWVTAGDGVAVSVNLSHGGLRHNGQLCDHEAEYHTWQAAGVQHATPPAY